MKEKRRKGKKKNEVKRGFKRRRESDMEKYEGKLRIEQREKAANDLEQQKNNEEHDLGLKYLAVML